MLEMKMKYLCTLYIKLAFKRQNHGFSIKNLKKCLQLNFNHHYIPNGDLGCSEHINNWNDIYDSSEIHKRMCLHVPLLISVGDTSVMLLACRTHRHAVWTAPNGQTACVDLQIISVPRVCQHFSKHTRIRADPSPKISHGTTTNMSSTDIYIYFTGLIHSTITPFHHSNF